jgi:hypothetical protein
VSCMTDLAGRTFGKWYVTKRDPAPSPYVRWLCVCQCGNTASVISQSLVRGVSVRCRRCACRDNKERITSKIWAQIRWGAKSRNLPFDLDKDYLWQLYVKQDRLCALSGIPIGFANTSVEHTHGQTTASLDRIDSSKGYVRGNVQWVHKTINKIKWELDQQHFIHLCSLVAEWSARSKVKAT